MKIMAGETAKLSASFSTESTRCGHSKLQKPDIQRLDNLRFGWREPCFARVVTAK
jgi:hypothetical protein